MTMSQFAVANDNIVYSGGDGSSVEKAVVIHNASNTMTGIRAERTWIAQRYPGFQKKRQGIVNQGGKMFDLIEIETADGKQLSVYFDITDFFGKW